MKAKIWILFLTYSINIPYKYVNFHINLLIESSNYGQNYSQFKLIETQINKDFEWYFVVTNSNFYYSQIYGQMAF